MHVHRTLAAHLKDESSFGGWPEFLDTYWKLEKVDLLGSDSYLLTSDWRIPMWCALMIYALAIALTSINVQSNENHN
jgi:hypothetical protein